MSAPVIGSSTNKYFYIDTVGCTPCIKVKGVKEKGSTLGSLQGIEGKLRAANMCKDSQIQEKNLREIATKIFDGYNKKFGFARFFNFFLVLIGRGDKNYNRIHDTYKEIMNEKYNENIIDLPIIQEDV